MKKYLIIFLSVLCACCLMAAYGCDDDEEPAAEHTTHTWVATEETDEDGNVVYQCSECGEVHTHTYSSVYTSDSTGHWYASTCSSDHSGYSPRKGFAGHTCDEGSTVCNVCGYDTATYNVEFSYYQYDSDGNIVYDSTGSSYVEVGVTYTAVESSSGITVDVENGETLRAGDVISFTVKKNVYCYYTDSNDYPVVQANDGVFTPDADGVYNITISADMASSDGDIIIWVSNVETRSSTIGGTGTQSDPYTINSVTDWLYFASFINNKTYYGVSYNIAYWELTCDLDFEGDEMYVIGNGYSSSYSAFMGNFNGNGHKLSNFVLTNEISGSSGTYSTYLGLFGVASAYNGVSAVIQNLNLKDFTVKATVPSGGTTNSSSSSNGAIVGTVVGYGVGFNLMNCSATNGTITVTGNSDYYSYAGGLVGILQSYMDEEYDLTYYSSLQYCSVTDITISGSGVIYAAGGLAAYAMPYSESASVYLINNYASGISVSGGMNTGGIVGVLGRHSSLQNCYVVGNISAYAASEYYLSDFEGTVLDARYANAGGLVGYAENDTFIGYSFFVGECTASSSAGSRYVRTDDICGGYASAGFEELSANEVIFTDNLSSSEVSDSKLRSIGWNSTDWVFGSSTYPTINSETSSRTFTITVSVKGDSSNGISDTTKTVTVDSSASSYVYIPLSYRYILSDFYTYGYLNTDYGVAMYMRAQDGNGNYLDWRTYGYYFDADCTQRVPSCYVIMGDITLYAKYVDCSAIIGKEYYATGNGVTATITLYASGLYEYEEGAVYLSGTYEYDGDIITFLSAGFSRLSSDATSNQTASYYTFYATVDSNGDLQIYDCTSTYTDTYSTSYDYLARFYAKSSPLTAVNETSVSVAGKYYGYDTSSGDENGNVFTLNKDYTGTYTFGNTSGSLTYTVSGDTVTLTIGARTYTAALEDGKISALTSNGNTTYYKAFDSFEGTWQQAGLITRSYTFDGKGGWTYAYGTDTDNGTYTINNGVAEFTRTDNTDVTVTIEDDGTLSVSESSGTLSVSYFAENSYAGVWYTYSYNETRYTLTLGGINSKGWGEAEFEGTDGFRYYAYSEDTIYVYYGDTLYAQLAIDGKGVMTGVFYNSSTGELDLTYTFYMYDSLYGEWVGTGDFVLVSFNGFGMYNVAEPADSSERAVNGVVTINGSEADYTVDTATGKATFTYNGVEYTLEYDEFNNKITVTYTGGSIDLEERDAYYGIVFEDASGNTYSFDGRGNLTGGGTVTITDSNGGVTTATYVINNDGTITVGSSTITYSDTDGYRLDGSTLYVQNSFTGEWAVNGKFTDMVIDATSFIINEDTTAGISGKYGGEDITLYYYGVSGKGYTILTFKVSVGTTITTYYVTALNYGLVLSLTADYTDEESDMAYMTAKDVLYGEWTNSDGDAMFFDGTYGGAYNSSRYVLITTASGETSTGKYSVSTKNGVTTVTVTIDSATYKYTRGDTSSEGAYANGVYYLTVVTE